MFNFERDLFGRVTWQGEGEEQRERWRERPSVAASLPKYLQQLRLRYTNARNMGIHLVLICGLQELKYLSQIFPSAQVRSWTGRRAARAGSDALLLDAGCYKD